MKKSRALGQKASRQMAFRNGPTIWFVQTDCRDRFLKPTMRNNSVDVPMPEDSTTQGGSLTIKKMEEKKEKFWKKEERNTLTTFIARLSPFSGALRVFFHSKNLRWKFSCRIGQAFHISELSPVYFFFLARPEFSFHSFLTYNTFPLYSSPCFSNVCDYQWLAGIGYGNKARIGKMLLFS